MKPRPEFIKHCEELISPKQFSYPGDTETFGRTALVSRELGFERLAVNFEILEPGDRSSWPHAHSLEEELVFIIEGKPHAWIHGETFELNAGDCVAFKPGTGIGHCIINNSEKPVRLLVAGERSHEGDKIFYPKHPARNEEMKERGYFWSDYPRKELGSHDGWPDRKRPR